LTLVNALGFHIDLLDAFEGRRSLSCEELIMSTAIVISPSGNLPPESRAEIAGTQDGAKRVPSTAAARDLAEHRTEAGHDRLSERWGAPRAAVSNVTQIIDEALHAAIARMTAGLSPAALAGAYFDWANHLAAAPGKRFELADTGWRNAVQLLDYAYRCMLDPRTAEPCIGPLPQDRRFIGESWQQFPFNFIHQGFLLNEQWWHAATTGIHGVSWHHEQVVEFAARQMLDMFSPSNFLVTNPEVLRRTAMQGGANLVNGFRNLIDDVRRAVRGEKPAGAENFVVGQNIATTPGTVVYRNRLIELIRYAPATDKVRPEPVLIVPAWIMKYYILDLSPHNSLVRYLIQQGFTVFVLSWKNPTAEDHDLSMEDYRTLGVVAALDAISTCAPGHGIHAIGYCLGGTLLSIAAAAMARDGDRRLRTMTLFAAQTDFTEAGELMLFIDESQVAFLEELMWQQGYLGSRQMAGTFQLLRSNDLIWSYMIQDYLMGEREPMTDLMAWNADATRMPARMHSEYLRRMFLNNDLAEGRYMAGSRPVALSDIHIPIFAVGTQKDHVAPWRSTHKIHLLTDAEVTYVLTTGGHNAGIVSEIGHKGRSYQIMTRVPHGAYVDPGTWVATAPQKNGSWWPELTDWLAQRSGKWIDATRFNNALAEEASLGPAPGTYVLRIDPSIAVAASSPLSHCLSLFSCAIIPATSGPRQEVRP
jgi:polyhydroxyalkanoate synthase subunit PhaC